MNNLSAEKKTSSLFLNPFQYIAGAKALLLGVAIIIISSITGYVSNCRFDGLFDAHIGVLPRAPFLVFLAEGLGNWLVIALLLTLTARIVTKSKYRAFDIFGTSALARFPYFLITIVTFIPGISRYSQFLVAKYLPNTPAVTVYPADLPLFITGTILMVALTIYSITLLYRAFSVSCNAKNTKATVYFIVVCLVGELLTKVLSIGIITALK